MAEATTSSSAKKPSNRFCVICGNADSPSYRNVRPDNQESFIELSGSPLNVGDRICWSHVAQKSRGETPKRQRKRKTPAEGEADAVAAAGSGVDEQKKRKRKKKSVETEPEATKVPSAIATTVESAKESPAASSGNAPAADAPPKQRRKRAPKKSPSANSDPANLAGVDAGDQGKRTQQPIPGSPAVSVATAPIAAGGVMPSIYDLNAGQVVPVMFADWKQAHAAQSYIASCSSPNPFRSGALAAGAAFPGKFRFHVYLEGNTAIKVLVPISPEESISTLYANAITRVKRAYPDLDKLKPCGLMLHDGSILGNEDLVGDALDSNQTLILKVTHGASTAVTATPAPRKRGPAKSTTAPQTSTSPSSDDTGKKTDATEPPKTAGRKRKTPDAAPAEPSATATASEAPKAKKPRNKKDADSSATEGVNSPASPTKPKQTRKPKAKDTDAKDAEKKDGEKKDSEKKDSAKKSSPKLSSGGADVVIQAGETTVAVTSKSTEKSSDEEASPKTVSVAVGKELFQESAISSSSDDDFVKEPEQVIRTPLDTSKKRKRKKHVKKDAESESTSESESEEEVEKEAKKKKPSPTPASAPAASALFRDSAQKVTPKKKKDTGNAIRTGKGGFPRGVRTANRINTAFPQHNFGKAYLS